MRMWKVFEEHGGRPRFLYHGLRGTRDVPLDRWLKAERKWVSEGSNPYYWSAFHVFLSQADVAKWKRKAPKVKGRVCVEVDTGPVRHKPTAGLSHLACRMRVRRRAWERRIAVSDLGT